MLSDRSLLRKIFIPILCIPFLNLHAQETIGGTVNSYYAVDSVFTNQVKINAADDIGSLASGDKVLLVQMTGATFFTNPSFPTANGIYSSFNYEGNYEFLAVQSVNTGTRRVTFTADLIKDYTDGEKIQLVKVYENNKAIVTSTLTADDWNGNKGGIIALVVYEKLSLNADINIAGKGFRGGIPVTDYEEVCRPVYDPDTFYFQSSESDKAGAKGEGVISVSFTYTRGIGNLINGGGGANGLFGGGGGGSNYGRGRKGGAQHDSCTSAATQYAYGGIALGNDFFYKNNLNRITMGGGGGCSTQSASNNASLGGDGSGILIIMTDTLLAVSGGILADGESILGSAEAGGGGGGAGGTVILDIANYQDNLSIDVSGGKGGNTTTCSGAGGGGGGGIVWYSGESLPGNVSVNVNGGARGLSSCGQNGSEGEDGGTLSGFSPILNGFLFNYVLGTDTVCAGNQPNVLIGSRAKGKSALGYQWIQSTDSINWVAASGTGDSLSFQPSSLSTTTYFTRIVSDGPIRDTARSIKIYVYPAITNNAISVTDTLCEGQSTGMLNGGTPGGGDGSNYSFNWQSSVNEITWNNIGSSEDIPGNTLTITTYYRRIIQSTQYCIDTSETDIVTVLDDIANNEFITADTVVCDNLEAGLIHPRDPQNGDGIYRYTWLVSNNDVAYAVIPGETGADYSPGILPATRYYKRVVYSGNEDVCADTTSEPKTVNVLPAITNNSINTDSTRFCAGDIPDLFTGTAPSGGQAGSYSYRWIRRTDATTWSYIEDQNGINYDPSQIYEDTTRVARVVLSGQYNACRDTSNIVLLDVIPYILNTLVSEDETLCESTVPAAFTESVASGGDGSSYTYLWQYQPGGSGDWLDAPTDISSNTLPSYASPALFQTAFFRRRVTSQICQSLSNSIQLTVYPLIADNVIEGAPVQYTCFNAPANVMGRQPSGGSGSYTYRWQNSIDDVTWENASGQNNSRDYISDNLTDSLYFRRMVFSGEDEECKDTTESVLVLLNPLPEGDISSSIDTACAGDNIVVAYSVNGNGPWILGFGNENVFYRTPQIAISEGTVEVPVEYENAGMLRLTELQDDSTCFADLSEATGQIDLTVYQVPEPDPGPIDSICGLEYQLNATPSVGIGVWSSSTGTVNDPFDPASQASVGNYGEHIFTWTETNWNCQESNDVTIGFFEQPEFVFAGEDQTLVYDFITNLEATEPEIGNGLWSTNASGVAFDDVTLNTTEVEFDILGAYILIWTISNGACIPISDSVTVTVQDLKVYKGFSPNGDGINDEFILELPGRYNTELIILNRWGKLIYETQGLEEIRWDGKNLDGDALPSDTYYYIVKEDGEIKTKGYVELRK